jgi:hypothetical protein
MELANWTNPEFRDEAYRVFMEHSSRSRYPKPLTVPELISQIENIPYGDLTYMAGQIGGGGKLSSQFRNYVRQCSCACWPSWKEAWRDFATFMGFTEPENIEAMNEVFKQR